MCQMCEEADRYMAQLQADEKKAQDARARGEKTRPAAGKRDDAAAPAGAK